MEEGKELLPSGESGNLQSEELSVGQVVAQVRKIQELMQQVMRKDEHYGTIPGTQKPTLYKAGAEKLGFTFRLAPRFHGEREPIESPNDHREYVIKCELYNIKNGYPVGEGLGSCSTMESKYRYRWENTNNPVPQDYWKHRDPSYLGGDTYTPRKAYVEGKQTWMIFQRIEHSDPADYYNTCLKMAKKRAHVDAMLTCTAASDLFTQDLEDMAPETRGTQQGGQEETHEDMPNCPQCKNNKSVIRGQAQYGGGFVCWRKSKPPGCGATWKDTPPVGDKASMGKVTGGGKTGIFTETETHKKLTGLLHGHCDGDFIKMGAMLEGLTQWQSGDKTHPGKKDVAAISEKAAQVAIDKYHQQFGMEGSQK